MAMMMMWSQLFFLGRLRRSGEATKDDSSGSAPETLPQNSTGAYRTEDLKDMHNSVNQSHIWLSDEGSTGFTIIRPGPLLSSIDRIMDLSSRINPADSRETRAMFILASPLCNNAMLKVPRTLKSLEPGIKLPLNFSFSMP